MRTKQLFARALLILLPLVQAATPVAAAEDIQLLLTTGGGTVLPAREVDIFRNDDYDDPVLKPGSEGTFTFTITNPEGFDVDFRLAVNEENLHGIPLEFSLQANGKTVLEDGDAWMTAQELADHEECLAAGDTKEMALHWRWLFTVDDERDTADTLLGRHEEATLPGAYALLLDVYAAQDDGTGSGKAPGWGGTYGGPAAATGKDTARAAGDAPGASGNPRGDSRVQTGDDQPGTACAALLSAVSAACISLVLLRKRTRKGGSHG